MLFCGSLTVIFFSSTPYPTQFSSHSVIREPGFAHTHLVLSGFVPAVDSCQNQLMKLQICSQTATRHSYYLLFAVFLQLLNSPIAEVCGHSCERENLRILVFLVKLRCRTKDESLSQPAGRKKKKIATSKSEAVLLSCICLLPLISSDRTNNTAKRRHSIRPSTCQTAF